MKNKKIIIIGSVLVVILLLVILVISQITKTPNNKPDEIVDTTEDEKIFSKEDLENIEKYMNQFDTVRLTHQLNKRSIEFGEQYDYGFKTEDECVASYVSIINIKEKTDITITSEDYYKSDYSNQLNFEEIFGFNYKECDNIYDVVMMAAKIQGFDTYFVGSEWNKDSYDYGQMVFESSYNSDVLQKIEETLNLSEDAKITKKYNTYRVLNDGCSHNMYIYQFLAGVQYEENNISHKYTSLFEAFLPESDISTCVCGCGSPVDDCDCEEDTEEPDYQ